MQLVICESCGESFKMEQKDIKRKKVKPGILEIYFSCPHCKSLFHVGFVSKEIEKLQVQYQTKRTLLFIAMSDNMITQEMIDEVESLKDQIKRKMNALNGK